MTSSAGKGMAARSYILQDKNLLERATWEVFSKRRELGPRTGNRVKLVLCEKDIFPFGSDF